MKNFSPPPKALTISPYESKELINSLVFRFLFCLLLSFFTQLVQAQSVTADIIPDHSGRVSGVNINLNCDTYCVGNAGGAGQATIYFDPAPEHALVSVVGFRRTNSQGGQMPINNTTDGNLYTQDWSYGGELTATFTPAASEIDVRSNDLTISSGDVTPIVNDNSHFGVQLLSSSTTRFFRIYNTGVGALGLTGTSRVAITGTNAGDFSVSTQPNTDRIHGGKNASFIIRFTPSALGTRTATVTIVNSDTNEGTYTFNIAGTGVSALPDINIVGNGQDIPDTYSAPSTDNDTDFGPRSIGSGAVTKTFTIENKGTGSLDLSTGSVVSFMGDAAADFSVVTQPTSPVSPNSSRTFQVAFTPSVVGTRNATLYVNNYSPTENPYTFSVRGTGTAGCTQVATATQSMSWNGSVSNDWTNPCNWTPNGVPTQTNPVIISSTGGAVVIPSGTNAAAKSISLSGGLVTKASLTISQGSTLRMGSTESTVTKFNMVQYATVTNNGLLILETSGGGGVNSTFEMGLDDNVFHNYGGVVINSTNATPIQIGNNSSNPTNAIFHNYACASFTNYSGAMLLNSVGISIFNNAGLFRTFGNLGAVGTFTNQNGGVVFVGGTLTHNPITTNNGSVRINVNPTATTMFTYNGTYNGTIEIFTDAGVSNSAGTYNQATNTFTPSNGLPAGSVTLYIKITSTANNCSYVVPIIYQNGCPQVATSTDNMTWNGSVSSDWTNPCNWTPNGVPGAGNVVVIPTSSTYPTIATGVNASVKQVSMTGNSRLTVETGASLTAQNNNSGIYLIGNAQFINRGSTTVTNTTASNQGQSAVSLPASTTTFDNYGTLTLNGNQNIGLYLEGAFNNKTGATLTASGHRGVNVVFGGQIINESNAIINSNKIEVSGAASTFTNQNCGVIKTTADFSMSANAVFNNYGYANIGTDLGHYTATTNNYGVLKYNSLVGSVNNTTNSVVVNNTTPIFTFGASYNGNVNGIFTNEAATTSAGTYTQATNTFTPSGGLPTGSQTLYAKITPNTGGCFYVVPFTYTNAGQPDYSISTSGNNLIITDLTGTGETLDISQNNTNIRFNVAGKKFSLNNGTTTNFPADVPLSNLGSITVNTANGNDIINVGAFNSEVLPSLTINGGTGDDQVNFNGDITFITNANLDVDLQNDDANPGVDAVTFAINVNIGLQGTGVATLKVSKNVVFNNGSTLGTNNGNLTIEANQQATPTTGNFIGISMNSSTQLQVLGSGLLTVKGKGGNDASGGQLGISLNFGGVIYGGHNTVTVVGNGGASSGNSNHGILIQGSTAKITSLGGAVNVEGTGGGTGTSGTNVGVSIILSGEITSAGTGAVTVTGRGATLPTGNANVGVSVQNSAKITSVGGNVTVNAYGGGTGTSQSSTGLFLRESGEVSAGGTGSVTITGEGSQATGFGNHGMELEGLIKSAGGDITLTGKPGSPSAFTYGFYMSKQTSAPVSSITTAVNGGNISITTNSLYIVNSPDIRTNAASSVTLKPFTAGTAIDISFAPDGTNAPLILSDSELDRISTGTLIIGDATAGDITVGIGVTRPTSTNMQLISSGDVAISGGGINTGGGTLLLDPGASTKAVKPTFNGTDVTASTLSFANGDLQITLNGTTLGDGTGSTYSQLNVAGVVNLTGLNLTFTGSYTPVGGETFTIVSNDGTDAIVGTFNGLAQGATISDFRGSGLTATISYTGGSDNNDVVITVASSQPDYSISTSGNNLIITDLTGTGETLDISQNNTNIHFNVAGKKFSLNNGTTTNFPADVALNDLASITVNTANGSDIINVGAFTGTLPSLTINGGTGNDQVNFNGDITFISNANLDVDLQNDDANPGVDAIAFAANANVSLVGTGAATLKVSKNVSFNTGSSLTTTNGNLTIEANQQAVPTTDGFYGINVGASVNVGSTGSGAVTLVGKGGATGGSNRGISIAGTVSGGMGTLTLTGQGGAGTGIENIGIRNVGTITSLGGNVSVTATGGGAGASHSNFGIYNEGTITAGNTGTVTVLGTGGQNGNHANYGVYLTTSNALITSSGGNVSVTGQGGGGTPSDNGIQFVNGNIGAGGAGSVTIRGTANGQNGYGVFFQNGTITSSGGNISLTGEGKAYEGVILSNSASITAGGTGNIVIYGAALSGTGTTNRGITVNNTSQISTSGGNIEITAVRGNPDATDLALYATLSTATNGGNITLIADDITMGSTAAVTTQTGGQVFIRPRTNNTPITLGSGSATSLSLDDDELDAVSTGTLNIGNANSGSITINGTVSRPAATAMNLTSNGAVTTVARVDLNGGNLHINANAGTNPDFSGTDLTVGTVSFTTNNDLNIAINGTTMNTGYKQLNVAGGVNLTGVDLVFSGSYTPVGGETFTIVNNDGTDAIVGTFNGLAQGATIPNFRGSGLTATISYTGGSDNNDVVITVAAPTLADINIQGNGFDITNGDTSPRTEDGTNFGDIDISLTEPVIRSFTIQNTGTADLVIPANGITKSGASDFGIGHVSLPLTIAPGGSATFPVIIDASGNGQRTATISIQSNDADESPYTFDVRAVGVSPEINVTGLGQNILDGDITPSGLDDTDFGILDVASGSVSHTFTIQNVAGASGNLQLGTGAISVIGTHSSDFTISAITLPATINAGQSTTFVVTFNPSALGLRTATVRILNNDLGEGTYDFTVQGYGGKPFITTWKTDQEVVGNTSITIPTKGTGYNYDVDWNNDGIFDQFGVTGNVTHNYDTPGTYTVAIRGLFPHIYFENDADNNLRIIAVNQWGDIDWKSFEKAFLGCGNLQINASDTPDLNDVADMSDMFKAISAINQDISGWDVSNVTNMASMFSGVYSFNQNISGWNVSNVTNMSGMFRTTTFNQNIGSWDVSKVTSMQFMFFGATAFDQSLAAWGTKLKSDVNLTNMLDNCGMSVANYDATLIGFNQGTATGRSLGAAGLKYCTAVADRDNLLTTKSWTITGDAQDIACSSPDYTITTTSNTIVITDAKGASETVEISENSGKIRFNVTGKTYSIDGGLTTAFTTPAEVALASKTSIVINTAVGNDIINVGAFATPLPSLTINGGTGDDAVNFNGDITFASNANLEVDLQNDDAMPGVDAINFAVDANIVLSGMGTATLKVSKNVTVNAGSSLLTQNGNLVVEANQQATPTTGEFAGIDVDGGTLKVTGSGQATLKGKGGTTFYKSGISVSNGGRIEGGTAAMSVIGTGGIGSGNENIGVSITGNNSKITSSGGNVSVTGQGAGVSNAYNQHGVVVKNGGMITAGGTGTVTVQGTGAAQTQSDTYGVHLNGGTITSSGGNVSVTGLGGGNSTSFTRNHGIYLQNAALISAGGTGTVTANGTGGNGINGSHQGIFVIGSAITSNDGNISLTGQSGGASESSSNRGIVLEDASRIAAGGTGSVTIEGTGSSSTAGFNYGVQLGDSNCEITTNNGNIRIIGRGGQGIASPFSNATGNTGVGLSGNVIAGGTGTIYIEGTGASQSFSDGIEVGGVVNTNDGTITIVGVGGANASAQFGSLGVDIDGTITAGNGKAITIQGTAGSSTGTSNIGVYIRRNISSTTGGSITVTGIEGGSGVGIEIESLFGGQITTANAGGNIAFIANSINIKNTANISTNTSSTVTLRPYTNGVGIDLGAATDALGGSLNLSDGELDRITAGTLQIGDVNSGAITVSSAISRAAATNVNLTTAGVVNLNASALATNGGNLAINAAGGINPTAAGTDVNVGTASFTSGNDLAISINGATADTDYRQLKVEGSVNLAGLDLVLSGSHVPVLGQSFVIVNNDGSDATQGVFNGLPEGATIAPFLGSQLNARISYVGGDGNDVVLTAIASVELPSNTANVTICKNATASLSATCLVGQETWYNAAGTTQLFVGSSFVTPTLSASTGYKVRCELAPQLSGFIDVMVTVVTPPTITLSALQQTLNEGNNPVLCDTDGNPVNSLQFTVSGLCVSGSPVWRVQVGSGAWSAWSPNSPVSQSSNNQVHRYQAACDANCTSTYSGVIELTINNRATVPQNVSLVVDGVTVAVGESKEVCSLVSIPLMFNANCATGEIVLYSVDGGEYSSGVPTGLVDNQFHNYRIRCRKSDGTPSCVESESGVMRLKLVTIPTAPTVSLSSTTSCDATASFSGQSSCGSLRTVWYNATTNVALPNLPSTVPSQTTSYYARCQTENGCVSEKSNVVTFTLTPTQVAPVVTASQEIVCTGTTVRISANCPAGSQTFWNTGVTTPSFEVAFSNVTKQTYWAKCLFDGGCQSSESVRKDIYWNAFVVTLINVGETKSSVKPANDKSLWSSQFIMRDGGPELEQSTQQNPTLYFVENANKIAPRYWTINVEACGLSTDGSLTFDMLATPEVGVIRSFNTHENNAPYFMYANREGWTELYAQNHPAYGFYQDNGAGGNVYDAGLPKGLYKLGIRYWDMKGWGSIYPSTRQPQGNVLAYQEYWFRIQSRDGVGVGAARTADSGEQVATSGGQGSDRRFADARDLNPSSFATVLPNPISNVLRLKVQDSKGQAVQTALTDASGREVLRRMFVPETNTHQEEFEVSELPTGMYFLKVSSLEKQTTLKVVKVN